MKNKERKIGEQIKMDDHTLKKKFKMESFVDSDKKNRIRSSFFAVIGAAAVVVVGVVIVVVVAVSVAAQHLLICFVSPAMINCAHPGKKADIKFIASLSQRQVATLQSFETMKRATLLDVVRKQ